MASDEVDVLITHDFIRCGLVVVGGVPLLWLSVELALVLWGGLALGLFGGFLEAVDVGEQVALRVSLVVRLISC